MELSLPVTPRDGATKLTLKTLTAPNATDAEWAVTYNGAAASSVVAASSDTTIKNAGSQSINFVVTAPEKAAKVSVNYDYKVGSAAAVTNQTATATVANGVATVTISSIDGAASGTAGDVVVTVNSITATETGVDVTYTGVGVDESKANTTTVVKDKGSQTIKFYVDVPEGASKLTVVYSVDGAAAVTDTNVGSTGEVTVAGATYTKDVVINVMQVVATEFTLDVDDAALSGMTLTSATTSVALAGGTAVNNGVLTADNDTYTVVFTVTNGSSSLTAQDGKYTVSGVSVSTTGTVDFGTITPDGNGPVTITIVSVTAE